MSSHAGSGINASRWRRAGATGFISASAFAAAFVVSQRRRGEETDAQSSQQAPNTPNSIFRLEGLPSGSILRALLANECGARDLMLEKVSSSARQLFGLPPLSALAFFGNTASCAGDRSRGPLDALDDLDKELERALQEAFGAGPPRPQVPQQQSPPPVRRRGYVNESGHKLMWTIIGINTAVFGAFQVPQLQGTMMRWFLGGARSLNQGARGMASMFLSTYGHAGFLHLAFNMMALHSFAPLLMDGRNSVYTPLLSTLEFFTFYTAAGLAGSVASAAFFRKIGNYTPSLGASGSIFGLVTYFCLMHPQAGLTVMFVLPMTAQTGLLVGTGLNVYLVVRAIQAARMGSTGPMVDGMAHLAGQAVGLLWFYKRRAEEMAKVRRGAAGGGGGAGGMRVPHALPVPPSSSPVVTGGRSGGIDI